MTDTLQSNVLTIAPDGTVGADFTGTITALGLTIPAQEAASPTTQNMIVWERSDGSVVARMFGESAAGSETLDIDAIAAGSADRCEAQILALDDTLTEQANVGISQTARGQGLVSAFAQGAGSFRTIIDSLGRSSFLQLLSAQRLQLAFGTDTWTWPGGNVNSNLKATAHGLGRVPVLVFVQPNQDQGAGATQLSWSVSALGAANFSSRASFAALSPGAGSTATFFWAAIG